MPAPNNQFQNASKNFKPILWVSLLLLVFAAYKIYTDVFSPNIVKKQQQSKEAFLTVNSQKNYFKFLSQIRTNDNFINSESFIRLAALLKLEEKMKPGKYKLREGMNNFELVRMIIKGRQEAHRLGFKVRRKTC